MSVKNISSLLLNLTLPLALLSPDSIHDGRGRGRARERPHRGPIGAHLGGGLQALLVQVGVGGVSVIDAAVALLHIADAGHLLVDQRVQAGQEGHVDDQYGNHPDDQDDHHLKAKHIKFLGIFSIFLGNVFFCKIFKICSNFFLFFCEIGFSTLFKCVHLFEISFYQFFYPYLHNSEIPDLKLTLASWTECLGLTRIQLDDIEDHVLAVTLLGTDRGVHVDGPPIGGVEFHVVQDGADVRAFAEAAGVPVDGRQGVGGDAAEVGRGQGQEREQDQNGGPHDGAQRKRVRD